MDNTDVRYKSNISIKLHELALMLMAYYGFYNKPEVFGECRDDGTYDDLCKEIDGQSEIWLTPKQLFDLQWYYKQAVLERKKLFKDIMPNTYHPLMLSLRRQNPELFYEDKDGEIVMRDSPDITKYDLEG